MFKCRQRGNLKGFISKIKDAKKIIKKIDLDAIGRDGVQKLKEATPIDSQKTAESWSYKIENNHEGMSLIFINDNVDSSGTPVAILIRYGHATRGEGWVAPYDFMSSIFADVIKNILIELNNNLHLL